MSCRSIAIFLLFILFGPMQGYSSAQEIPEGMQAKIDSLSKCTDAGLGVVFLCDQNWNIQSVDDALLVIISTAPDVTMIITKIDSDVKVLEQLNNEKLKALKQYQDGFVSEKVVLGARDILKVKAFAREFPNRRMLDYYMVYNKELYGVLFAVEPKEETEQYQYLFKKIIESFSFLKK